MKKCSVVIPFFNEELNVEPLVEEVEKVMSSICNDWELIAINDGSTDTTGHLLEDLKTKKEFLRPIHFDRNYGQSSAFAAGFRAAKGDIVVTLDGDRQNDPTDIPRLLTALEGADLVCGKRQKRRDTLFKRTLSRIANWVRQSVCSDGVSDTGCSLKAYRKPCLDQIKMYHGMHRFLPALFVIEGFHVKEIPVRHRAREAGKSKYNLWNRSLNTVADLFAVRWMRKRQLRYRIRGNQR